MRVMHVVTKLSGGGAERFVVSMAPRIAEQGHASAIMTIDPCETPPELRSLASVEILHMRRAGRFDARFLARTVAAMRRWRPDVVHTHMHAATLWGRLAAVTAGVPCIVRTEHLGSSTVGRVKQTALACRALNSATSAIVTFFREQARYLAAHERIDPRKLAVIPNGIAMRPYPTQAEREEARRRLELDENTRAIVVIGHLHPYKNQRLALEAFARLTARERRRHRLFLIGRGPDRAMLDELARSLGIAGSVTFTGFRDDVALLLPGADLLLVSSLTEGMPLAVLEAMSAGVPVVSTPWTGVREMLHDGELGVIAAGFDAPSLTRAIEESAEDAERTRAMTMRAAEYARRECDISTCLNRHVELYQALLSGRSAA